jgi:hypothetical protein
MHSYVFIWQSLWRTYIFVWPWTDLLFSYPQAPLDPSGRQVGQWNKEYLYKVSSTAKLIDVMSQFTNRHVDMIIKKSF